MRKSEKFQLTIIIRIGIGLIDMCRSTNGRLCHIIALRRLLVLLLLQMDHIAGIVLTLKRTGKKQIIIIKLC